MDKVLKYSVFRYRPSIISGETINLGVLFDAQDGVHLEFKHIKKYSRVASFDDELDLDRLKSLISGIRDDVSGTLFTKEQFDIDNYVKFFINDFSFDKPQLFKYSKWDDAVTQLYKSYLRFDLKKSERLSKVDDIKVMKGIISSSWTDYQYNESVSGPCDEAVRYDFLTKDFGLKVFDFENKDLTKFVQTAKAWAWNCENIKDRKTIIIYRLNCDSFDLPDFMTIKNIFKKANAEFYNWDEGINVIQQLGNSSAGLLH